MTKPFNVKYACERCGHQTTAETAFGRWMRHQPDLKSSDGIVRTDCDHIVLRYKTAKDGRDFQLMMVVEVKEYGADPDPAQRDILSFFSQTIYVRGRNMHGSPTTRSLRLKSRMLGRDVLVRNYGVHLLQFERTSPDDGWIKWNWQFIDTVTLTEILAFNRRPDNPTLRMEEFLRDRHAKPKMLFGT